MRLALAFALISISACNALTGADSLVAEGSGTQAGKQDGSSSGSSGSSGGGPTTNQDAGSSSGSTGPDGSITPVDSGPDPNDVILDVKFNSSKDCDAWSVVGNGTKTFEPTFGRTSAGACMLCMNAPGMADIERKGIVPHGGKLNALVYVQRLPNKSTPAGFVFTATSASGKVSTTQGFGANEPWTAGGTGVQASIVQGEDVTVSIGMRETAAGECIVVDDVLVTVK